MTIPAKYDKEKGTAIDEIRCTNGTPTSRGGLPLFHDIFVGYDMDMPYYPRKSLQLVLYLDSGRSLICAKLGKRVNPRSFSGRVA